MLKQIAIIICLLFLSDAASAFIFGSNWQVSVENDYAVIPEYKNLGVDLKKGISTLNSVGISINNFTHDKRKYGLNYTFSGAGMSLDIGKADLNNRYDYVDNSIAQYDIFNTFYIGYGMEIGMYLPDPWEVGLLGKMKYGTIPGSPINYSSRRSGYEFPENVRGSWTAVNMDIRALYDSHPLAYFMGIGAVANSWSLTYFDYPSSPDLENREDGRVSGSTIFFGLKYNFIEKALIQFKYLVPVDNKWAYGYNLKIGWDF